MPRKHTGRWQGGRIYEDKDGTRRYVIERMRGGVRYSVTLPPGTDLEQALLDFKKDPAGYSVTPAPQPTAAVVLSTAEVEAFTKYQTGKDLAVAYVNGVAGYLLQWATALNGRDFRRVTVAELYAHLDTWPTARNYRIVALKTWATYLTKRQRLKPGENAAAFLELEQAPTSRLGRDVAYTIKQVETFYREIDSQYIRDLFCVAAKTGMHRTEIQRISTGNVKITPIGKNGIAAVVTFVHKNKRDHKQSIDAQTLAALQRLIAHGRAPSGPAIHKSGKKTAARLEWKEALHPKYLRHSFATWLKECGRKVYVQSGGLDHAEVAAIINHRSGLMLKDRYDGSIPPMGVVAITLHHPADPVQIVSGRRDETAAAG